METSTLDRSTLLPLLFPQPDDYLMISGLAGASCDAASLTDDGDNLFTTAGIMGGAVSMGLGVALSAPTAKVVVITGDGELLMGVGSLATVASMAPDNLSIICIDNGLHAETGGQKGHTSRGTDLALMAQGAGIGSILTIHEPGQVGLAAKFLIEAPAPRFLLARVTEGPPAPYKRNFDPVLCRIQFRQAFLG